MALAPNASFNTQRTRLPPDYGMAPVGRNPQDAKFLQTTRRRAETPLDIASAISRLVQFLSPPEQVTMGGQTRRAGAGMVPNPEEIAARLGVSIGPLVNKRAAYQQIVDALSRANLGHPADEIQGPFSHLDEVLTEVTGGGHVPGDTIYGSRTMNTERLSAIQAAVEGGIKRGPTPYTSPGPSHLPRIVGNPREDVGRLLRGKPRSTTPRMPKAEVTQRVGTRAGMNLTNFPGQEALAITDMMGGRTGGQVFPLLQRTGPKSTDAQKALLQWYMSQAKRPHP